MAERPDNFWTVLAPYRIARLLPEHLRTERLPCGTVLRRLTPRDGLWIRPESAEPIWVASRVMMWMPSGAAYPASLCPHLPMRRCFAAARVLAAMISTTPMAPARISRP
jgi:hypothetical protein